MNRRRLARLRRQSRRNNIAERLISEMVSEETGVPIAVVRSTRKAVRKAQVAFAVKRHTTIATARFILNVHADPYALTDAQIKECADYLAKNGKKS